MRKSYKGITSKTILFMAMLCAVVVFDSCKKKDDATPQQANNAFPTPAYPKPSDADAVLVAVRASAPSPISMPVSIPGMDTELVLDLGMGIAFFKDNAKADKVLLNNTELGFTNGVHMWTPNFANITDPSSVSGIDLNGSITWKVTNPNIEQTLSGLPGKPKITSGKTVTKSAGYTINNSSAGVSGEVLYVIYDENGKSVQKTKSAGSTSCAFTASELSALGSTNNGIVQANAYIIESKTLNGKKVYFVRQSSYSVTGVTIN